MFAQILVALVAVLFAKNLWWRWKYDLHKVPSPGLLFLGSTVDFLFTGARFRIGKWLGDAVQRLGRPKLMAVWILGKPLLVSLDEDFLTNVMFSNNDGFPRSSETMSAFTPLVGNDPEAKKLFAETDASPYVKAIRSVYFAAFSTENLKRALIKMRGILDRTAARIEALRQEGPVDFQDLSARLILDTLGRVAFDSDFGGLDGKRGLVELFNEAKTVGRSLFLGMLNKLYVKLFPFSEKAKQFSSRLDDLTAHWRKLTDEILRRPAPPTGEQPIWDLLRNFVDPETGEKIPYKTLVAEIATVVFAGWSTTSEQLGFIVGLVASHPEVADKILAELEGAGLHGEGAREAEYGDLVELSYLTAVIKEGMRLTHVAAASLARVVPRDMIISGYRIPKGTQILSLGSKSFNVKEVWPDPRRFKPERWLTDEDHSFKWSMMFMRGQRNCVGKRLAMLKMRMAIISLVRRYRLKLEGDYQEVLLDNIIDGLGVRARGGIWVSFTPRGDPLS